MVGYKTVKAIIVDVFIRGVSFAVCFVSYLTENTFFREVYWSIDFVEDEHG